MEPHDLHHILHKKCDPRDDHHHHHHHHCCPHPEYPQLGPVYHPDPLWIHPPFMPCCGSPTTTKVYNYVDIVAGDNIVVTPGTRNGMNAFKIDAPEMIGVTETDDGKAGVVPAPTIDDTDKFLKSDGTWAVPDTGLDAVLVDDKTIKGDGVNSALYAVEMTGSSESTDGTSGIVPAPSSADSDKFLKGDGTWATPESGIDSILVDDKTIKGDGIETELYVVEMTGATETKDGTAGIVPAPTAAQKDYFLGADGQWHEVVQEVLADGVTITGTGAEGSELTAVTMKGATDTEAGKAGIVPAPSINSGDKFLKGDGTWANPSIQTDDETIKGDGVETPLYAVEMTGATETEAGKPGIVPAPTENELSSYLRSDKIWVRHRAFTFDELDEIIDPPKPDEPPVIIDGKEYKTVRMPDDRVWMAVNLDMETATGSIASNKHDENEAYGRLYQWDTAMAIANSVDGWHIPTKAEWDELSNYIGADPTVLMDKSWDAGSDLYGFGALPAGYYNIDAGYAAVDSMTIYWLPSERPSSVTNAMYIGFTSSYFDSSDYYKTTYFAVRLIKDN